MKKWDNKSEETGGSFNQKYSIDSSWGSYWIILNKHTVRNSSNLSVKTGVHFPKTEVRIYKTDAWIWKSDVRFFKMTVNNVCIFTGFFIEDQPLINHFAYSVQFRATPQQTEGHAKIHRGPRLKYFRATPQLIGNSVPK